MLGLRPNPPLQAKANPVPSDLPLTQSSVHFVRDRTIVKFALAAVDRSADLSSELDDGILVEESNQHGQLRRGTES